MSIPKANDLLSKRRRFQPPITTFFSTTSDANVCPSHLSHNHYSSPTHSPHPIVPAKVQASLLSVGMRVRKSVAEGYKTHQVQLDGKSSTLSFKETHTVRTQNPHSSPHSSELAPFCGLTKSGDSVQSLSRPQTTSDYMAGYDNHRIFTDDADSFSLPPSSQESVDSSMDYQIPTAQKRSCNFDENDDFLEDEFYGISSYTTRSIWQDPLRLNPITSAPATPILGRTILSPKLGHRRRQFSATMQKQTSMDIDDFEEPSFLRRREEVDMDYEAQMGGM